MSLYKRIDDYFLNAREPDDPPTRRQDARAHVREPAKIVFALGKNTWLLATCSWTNVLLPLIPVALAVSARSANGATEFWLNYIALVSAFGLFRYGSEELSLPALRLLGQIWDITLGAFSLDFEIVIIALCRGYLELAKAYVVGKIVSTTLLTLGICFLLAGIRRGEDRFNETVASTLTSLLATAIVPFGFLAVFPSGSVGGLHSTPVLTLSRAASFVLITLFLLYQLFRKTHSSLFYADVVEVLSDSSGTLHGDDLPPPRSYNYRASRQNTKRVTRSGQLNAVVAIGSMLVAAVVAYFCALPVLSASEDQKVPSKIFTGFCLLPILAEVAEISRIVRLAWVGRTEEAIVAAAGTSIQTALYIAPILCILGWCLGQPMSLSLDLLEVVSFGVSVWIFSYLLQDGKSNYMKGVMSITLYLIQVIAFSLYGKSRSHTEPEILQHN